MLPFPSVLLRMLSILVAVAGVSSPARANPSSLVPSAGVEGAPMSLHMRIDYAYDLQSSVIMREHVGGADADPLGGIPRSKDLEFHQFRHILTPRAEVGIFRDTWLSIALPIIISQARELKLASGIGRADSQTLSSGLLPPDGFDARDAEREECASRASHLQRGFCQAFARCPSCMGASGVGLPMVTINGAAGSWICCRAANPRCRGNIGAATP